MLVRGSGNWDERPSMGGDRCFPRETRNFITTHVGFAEEDAPAGDITLEGVCPRLTAQRAPTLKALSRLGAKVTLPTGKVF